MSGLIETNVLGKGSYFNARIWRMEKVLFSQVCVCQ